MKQFGVILCFALVALSAAKPGYRYQAPVVQQVQQQQLPQQPIRQSIPVGSFRPQAQQQTNSGIYSVVQSPPLAQFNVQSQQQQQLPQPQPQQQLFIAAPQQQQQQNFVAPQQHQQQTFVAPQQLAPAVITLPVSAPVQQQQAFVQQPQPQFIAAPQQQQFIQQQPIQQHIQQQPLQQHTIAIPSIPQSHQQQVVQQQLSIQQQPDVNGFQSNQFQSFQQRPQTAIITKDIFIHSAPEEHEDASDVGPQLDLGPIRKNYRIVFIKAPTQNLKLAAAALKRAQSTNEEKTVIYVLSKKPDLAEVQQHLQQVQGEQKTHKPEVYFIKYKTQEEAHRAQQEIQAQYDSLGGSTQITDEGVAPLTTVAGGNVSGGALNLGGSIGGVGVGGGSNFVQGGQQQSFVQQNFQSQSSGGSSSVSFGAAPTQKYLPAKALK